MADVKITDNHFEIVSQIENNQEQKQQSVPSILEYRNNHVDQGKSWKTLMTAELSPIHIGRLIPPGTPVGMERGLEDGRTCMNGFRMNKKIKMVKVDLCITMRWERAMLEEGAGLAHCPKTTWSLPGSGLHEQSHG